ncbi:MAG: molybdopterin molybdotransferase MoeA [Elusimicrobia bacterium]|nr:molybdopterin molybdotransferase MoeA [Elusimicrobiota bacterium]MBP9698467.1 molybdopterin molybdotransferase MoeA [Elusimicrobiota bacterium]
MITAEEALRIILENTAPLCPETVSLERARGRVLAQTLTARENSPPFDNAAMDGFAVRTSDLASASRGTPVGIPVQEVRPAGSAQEGALRPGHAVRIMTGAPVPPGADAIAIKETAVSDEKEFVRIAHRPDLGAHIRRAGEDVKAGDLLLEKGKSISPYDVALLAAQGMAHIPVIKNPRVGIVATGDELLAPSAEPSFGKIRNSNGPSLAAGVSRWGVDVVDLGLALDDPSALERAFQNGLETTDVLLISGGVSVGDHDYTSPVLKKMGYDILFWKVAIKPGKPLLFAKRMDGSVPRYAFGLPGNPVSALVCLEEFVRVALETLRGARPRYPSYHLTGRALNAYTKPVDRQQYLFCRTRRETETFQLDIIRPQGAAMMGMASRADALAVAPIGVSRIEPGDALAFRWIK